jgi:hypothetical protein
MAHPLGFLFSKGAAFDFGFSLFVAWTQRARRTEPFAEGINARGALFTDCSSGKCSATSGERSTRFVPVRYRAAYFRRTPPFNFCISDSGH